MSLAIAVDIETLPTAASMSLPYLEVDRQPPANYVSPEAREKWRVREAIKDKAEWEQDRLKAYSVNPRMGRVCAIGYRFGATESAGHSVAPSESEEVLLLRDFWAKIAPSNGEAPLLVTWNGAFDFRFLLVRSIHHKITPSWTPAMVSGALARYRVRPHFDVKAVLMQWDVRQKGEGLSEWATFFGLEGKIADGGEVYAMSQRGEWDRIGAYAQDDAEKTYAIYTQIAPYFL